MRKCIIKLLLRIPAHLNCVTTLPCEMSSVIKATIENKTTKKIVPFILGHPVYCGNALSAAASRTLWLKILLFVKLGCHDFRISYTVAFSVNARKQNGLLATKALIINMTKINI